MTAEIFTMCDSAQAYGDKLIIVGPFYNINADTLPVTLPGFAIVARLRYSETEGGSKKYEIRITDPDGSDFIKPIVSEFNSGGNTETIGCFNLNISFGQMRFTKAGKYEITLKGEDADLSLAFFVTEVKSGI